MKVSPNMKLPCAFLVPKNFEVFMVQNILKWLKNLVFGSSVGSKKPRGNPGPSIRRLSPQTVTVVYQWESQLSYINLVTTQLQNIKCLVKMKHYIVVYKVVLSYFDT